MAEEKGIDLRCLRSDEIVEVQARTLIYWVVSHSPGYIIVGGGSSFSSGMMCFLDLPESHPHDFEYHVIVPGKIWRCYAANEVYSSRIVMEAKVVKDASRAEAYRQRLQKPIKKRDT